MQEHFKHAQDKNKRNKKDTNLKPDNKLPVVYNNMTKKQYLLKVFEGNRSSY